MTPRVKAILSGCVLAVLASVPAAAQTSATITTTVSSADLDAEIKQFLAREIAAHVQDIRTLDPPPDRVVGALTTGEFSWGTFMRALAAYSELAGTQAVAGHNVPELVGKMGL